MKRIIRCWRCDRPVLAEMNTVKRDSRGRPTLTCRVCTLEIDKLDKKGL